MARILKDGDRVRDYEIVGSPLNRGAFAIAYKARQDGKICFFKQYKSPSGSVPWFNAYLNHQKLMKKRIESTSCINVTYRYLDVFAEKNTLYQVFEFVPNQKDLADFLNDPKWINDKKNWSTRVVFAKLLMSGMKVFHQAKIIHSDLKPQNVVLIEAPEIETGYRFKIADLDFSFMSDSPVPWKGTSQGFVGTPGYFSPEHIRGEQPTQASDVFTCGIMLYEILCGRNPYPDPDSPEYRKTIESGKVDAPCLLNDYPDANNKSVSDVILQCLNPDKTKRPSAEQVHQVLLNKTTGAPATPSRISVILPWVKKSEKKPAAHATPESPEPAKKETATEAKTESEMGAIELSCAGNSLRAGITTVFGKAILSHLGDDSRFASAEQFTLVRQADGWYVQPNLSAANETILNRKTLTETTRLNSGDELAIGRAAKDAFKLIMSVNIL